MIRDHVWSSDEARYRHLIGEAANMGRGPAYREKSRAEAEQLRQTLDEQ